MPDVFDYDVFLSFSSKDEETAKPIWQEFSQNGLRVFWSDETLKQNVGQSFFDVIQESLINSRHLVLLMSANAADSEWVKLEYRTFFNECFLPSRGERRLIIFPLRGYDTGRLPPFLKNLQIARSVKAIIPLLGGVDIEALRRENADLRERLDAANDELQQLRDEASGLRRLNANINQKLTDADQQIRDLQAAAAKASPQEKVETPRPKIRPRVELRPAGQSLNKMHVEKTSAESEPARPPLVAAGPTQGQRRERKIGYVSNYYARIGVALVNLDSQLRTGDRIRIKGHTTDFEQEVSSMMVGDKEASVANARSVTFKTAERCRQGDDVYKLY